MHAHACSSDVRCRLSFQRHATKYSDHATMMIKLASRARSPPTKRGSVASAKPDRSTPTHTRRIHATSRSVLSPGCCGAKFHSARVSSALRSRCRAFWSVLDLSARAFSSHISTDATPAM